MTMTNKLNRFFVPAGVVLFLALCLVPSGQAQCVPVSQPASAPFQLGAKCNFTAASGPTGGLNASGLAYWQIFFVPSGTVSAATLSLDSSAVGGPGNFSTGGVIAAATIGSMTSAGTYTNSSATTPTNFVQFTPTITGTGTVTVVIFGYTNPPTSTGGGGPSSNVSVTNFPSTQNVAVNAALPAGSNTIGGVTTQPTGFGTLIGFQQSVTASAVALSSNSAHSFCVEALPANTINIYVGPSGVTTSTGLPLAPGQIACWNLSNTNLVYVIAASTGASVAVSGV